MKTKTKTKTKTLRLGVTLLTVLFVVGGSLVGNAGAAVHQLPI